MHGSSQRRPIAKQPLSFSAAHSRCNSEYLHGNSHIGCSASSRLACQPRCPRLEQPPPPAVAAATVHLRRRTALHTAQPAAAGAAPALGCRCGPEVQGQQQQQEQGSPCKLPRRRTCAVHQAVLLREPPPHLHWHRLAKCRPQQADPSLTCRLTAAR